MKLPDSGVRSVVMPLDPGQLHALPRKEPAPEVRIALPLGPHRDLSGLRPGVRGDAEQGEQVQAVHEEANGRHHALRVSASRSGRHPASQSPSQGQVGLGYYELLNSFAACDDRSY